MTRFFIPALVLTLTLPSLGVPTPASQCEIAGQVIHGSTGAAIAKVRILVSEAASPSEIILEAKSDSQGYFRFLGMPPGKYILSIGRAGFLEYNSSADSTIGPIVLATGQRLLGLTIKLSPQAVITGRVFQDDGDPFSGVLVMAIHANPDQNDDGSMASYAYTNDLGEYRLFGLSAGRYYVHTRRRGVGTTTYYPHAANMADATALEVAAGGLVNGIDVTTSSSMIDKWLSPPTPPDSDSSSETTTATVQGQVVNAATGSPVPRARVLLDSSSDTQASSYRSVGVIADASGFFTLNNIQPGTRRISAQRRGFLGTESGGHIAEESGADVALSAGQSLEDVILKLNPSGVIAGKIFNEDGDPLARAMMMAVSESFSRGHRGFTVVKRVYTDDLGEYRLYDLPPGRYYVCVLGGESPASVESSNSRRWPFGRSMGWKISYPPAYYPSATSIVEATPLSVRPGAVLGGIDLRLSNLSRVRVRGRIVLPVDVKSSGSVAVSLIPADLAVARKYSRYSTEARAATGNFDLQGVPPGTYILAADWADQGRQFSSSRTIHVGKTDTDGLVLTLQPSLQIRGQLQMEGEREFDFSILHVSLQPAEGEIASSSDGTVNKDGSFTIENVRPGRYAVSLSGLDANNYLKAVYHGGKNVSYSGMDLSLGSAGTIELVLSPDGGGIEGRVVGSTMPATVALVPEAALAEGRELYRTVVTGQAGEFSMHGIAPGRYELIAADDIESAQELMAIDRAGEPVTIEENRIEKVQLPIVPAHPY